MYVSQTVPGGINIIVQHIHGEHFKRTKISHQSISKRTF